MGWWSALFGKRFYCWRFHPHATAEGRAACDATFVRRGL